MAVPFVSAARLLRDSRPYGRTLLAWYTGEEKEAAGDMRGEVAEAGAYANERAASMLTFKRIRVKLLTESGSPLRETYTCLAKVPGGWLIGSPDTDSLAFVPDPMHEWDGNSLP
jgi:hypothetical protein